MRDDLQKLLLALRPELTPEALAQLAEGELKTLLRAAMNLWGPAPLAAETLELQNKILQENLAQVGRVGLAETLASQEDARLRIWRGDITRLEVDAITNAANSALLGCFQPGHHCIDNAIHSAAGLQLRQECADYMASQGSNYREPSGQALVTQAYNLPSRWVVHTVGPIVHHQQPSAQDAQILASSYRQVLEAAYRAGASSLALCAISTGVFGYPKEEASQIAISQARSFLSELGPEADFTIVFNLFSQEDYDLYAKQLFA